MNNNFIIFEGLDGSGKTTASKDLKDFLNSKGHNTEWYHQPSDTPHGIRKMILENGTKSETAKWLLHSCSHHEQWETQIAPFLKSDSENIAILDRAYPSAIAYNCFGGNVDLELVKTVEENAIESVGISVLPKAFIFLDTTHWNPYGRKEQDNMDIEAEKRESIIKKGYLYMKAIFETQGVPVLHLKVNGENGDEVIKTIRKFVLEII